MEHNYKVGDELYCVSRIGGVNRSQIIDINENEYTLIDINIVDGKVKKSKWFCPFSCVSDLLFTDLSEAEDVSFEREWKFNQDRIKFISGNIK